MNVAIIGCGLIGKKRAQALGRARLTACVDVNFEKAVALASLFPGSRPFLSVEELIESTPFDIAIVSTLHSELFPIGRQMLEAGKHLLLEKPGALHSSQIETLQEMAHANKRVVRIGYNHRFHRAFQKAKELIEGGAIGELMFLRARYGHGGRVGYDREWRANPALSGGGELIDQGVHLIDLSRWILGNFAEVQGFAHTYYWDMPVEDNGFLLLKTARNQVAFLHASCTEWKNLFSFEIYGKTGKLAIQGLGGSYGVETLSFYKMSPQMGPPDTTIWEYPMADSSWEKEFEAFLFDIENQKETGSTLEDAATALRIVEQVYEQSKVVSV